MKPRAADGRVTNSRRDPELTQREILDAAALEFARHGPYGARTEDIAARTNTSKRMIYYYFESKEALYATVLQENYKRIRSLETELHLDQYEPMEALRVLIRSTLDHYEKYPQLAQIVALENLVMQGVTMERLDGMKDVNRSAPENLAAVLRRGQEAGVFRAGPDAPDALDVHQVLSALTLNRVEHRATFRAAFGRDMLGDRDSVHVRRLIEDTVLRLVQADPVPAATQS